MGLSASTMPRSLFVTAFGCMILCFVIQQSIASDEDAFGDLLHELKSQESKLASTEKLENKLEASLDKNAKTLAQEEKTDGVNAVVPEKAAAAPKKVAVSPVKQKQAMVATKTKTQEDPKIVKVGDAKTTSAQDKAAKKVVLGEDASRTIATKNVTTHTRAKNTTHSGAAKAGLQVPLLMLTSVAAAMAAKLL